MSDGERPVTQRLAAMRQLAGRFELRRWVGSGGVADVHVAYDRELEREVALKILRTEFLTDETTVARFRREATLLGMVDSPHVVAIHDVHIAPELAYLVLRLAPGQTLDGLVHAEGALPSARAVHIIGGVLAGLRELHLRRLVHRDLTPGNVVVDEHDTAVLLDLGIARDRRKRSLTPVNAAVGTPGYLVPELERGDDVDARGDQYQVGLLLLFALTGAQTDGNADAIANALDPVVPPLRAVVARALAPAPADRFADVTELSEALEAAVHALASRARRPSPAPPVREPVPTPVSSPRIVRTVSLRAKPRLHRIIPFAIAAFLLGVTLGIILTLTLTLT
jgi:serine/threonine-protein kinase